MRQTKPLTRRVGLRAVRFAERSGRAKTARHRTPYDGALAIPKSPPKRDPKLRAWIARQACLVGRLLGRDCPMKTHAAHVPTGTGGMGMKGDDLFVPLCFDHHINEQHGRGGEWFQRTYGIDLNVEAAAYRRAYDGGGMKKDQE